MDPLTAGTAAVVLGGINTVLSGAQAVSAYGAAEQQRSLHRQTGFEQARMLDRAAGEARRDAGHIRGPLASQLQGDITEQLRDWRGQGGQVVGEQSLSYLRGGVRISGSALNRLQHTQRRVDQGAEEIVQSGSRQQSQLRQRAVDLDRQAEDIEGRAGLARLSAARGGPPSGLAAALPHIGGALQGAFATASGIGNLQQRPQQQHMPVRGRAPIRRPDFNTTSESYLSL